jgi:hypothetical protein
VETCALAKRALDPGGAAMELGDVLDDAQAEAGAAQFPGACLVHGEEPLEDSFARLGGMPGPSPSTQRSSSPFALVAETRTHSTPYLIPFSTRLFSA